MPDRPTARRAEGYGKLRLLTLPEDDNVPGPGQVQNQVQRRPDRLRSQLNLLKQGQSEVINGNLLTVPVGGGLLYVQPVYVKSTGETSYPLLQKVLVAFGDQIAFQDTLDLALDVLFGGDSGADAGDNEVEPGRRADDAARPTATPTTPTAPSDEMQALLNQAAAELKNKQAALAEGDWAAYGAADAQPRRDHREAPRAHGAEDDAVT